MQENNANEAPQESNELQENGDSADANSDGLQWLGRTLQLSIKTASTKCFIDSP